MYSLNSIFENGLCTGCGSCVAFCKQEALSMREDMLKGVYVPVSDTEKCINCGLCTKICPGGEIDFSVKEAISAYDQHLGNYYKCYIGRSLNDEIFNAGSSGGVVSQFLIYLLRSGKIDGAITTRMDDSEPLKPEIFIAKTPDEILKGAKSKYVPVPLNIILKEIQQLPGKYAIIGLPCHLEGILKAQDHIPWLKQKVIYKFGLFCSHTPTFKATKLLLEYSGVLSDDVKRIDYRSGKHPSQMTVITNNGEKTINHKSWLYWGHIFYYYFWPRRCWLCPDKSAEVADISFGDNWDSLLKEEYPDCFSRMVLRNSNMEDLFGELRAENLLEIYQVPAEKINWDLKKKKNVGPRIFWEKILGSPVPSYGKGILPGFNVLDILTVIPAVLRIRFTEYRSIKKHDKYLFFTDYCLLTIWRYFKKCIFIITHPCYTMRYFIAKVKKAVLKIL